VATRAGRRAYGERLHFRVLGPLQVDAEKVAIPIGGPKQRAVLANLLIRPNEIVPAESLMEEIWRDEPPDKARNVIQTYVSHLRKVLGPTGSRATRRATA
jgi:DNA-binding SARP family transcriptional activator